MPTRALTEMTPNYYQLNYYSLQICYYCRIAAAPPCHRSKHTAAHRVDGRQCDINGWQMKFPDGTDIPQIRGCANPHARTTRTARHNGKKAKQTPHTASGPTAEYYTYLGTRISPSAAHALEPARDDIRRTTIAAIKIAGRIPMISSDKLNEIINVIVGGIVGYKARATPLTWADCDAIESARLQALRERDFCQGNPKVQPYETKQEGGLAHNHILQTATGAYLDQVEITRGAAVR